MCLPRMQAMCTTRCQGESFEPRTWGVAGAGVCQQGIGMVKPGTLHGGDWVFGSSAVCLLRAADPLACRDSDAVILAEAQLMLSVRMINHKRFWV